MKGYKGFGLVLVTAMIAAATFGCSGGGAPAPSGSPKPATASPAPGTPTAPATK